MKSKTNKKHVPDSSNAADITVIAENTRIDDAVMNAKGTVKIDGEYHGDINVDGELIVGATGYICGHVNASSADIYGNITGNVVCGDWLHIKATGIIKGDITCDAILVDEGAVFIGYSNMKDRASAESIDSIDDMIDIEMEIETETESEDETVFETLEIFTGA